MIRSLFALIFVAAVVLAALTTGHAQMVKTEKFDIKGDGGTDYLTVEPATGRVFVSRSFSALDPKSGDIIATAELEDTAPEGAAADGQGHIFVNNEGNVTVVHQDSPDKYTVVATVPTFPGAKTISVDPKTHNVYLFQPERGPAPPPAPDAPPPAAGAGGRGRGPQGPIIAAWFIVIKS